MKYRKKPVLIDAVQFKGTIESLEGLPGDMENIRVMETADNEGRWVTTLIIKTLEGPMTAQSGDYIICGVAGEYYPCKPDIFHETYDPVPEVTK